MQLKKLMSVLLFSALSSQSFASEEVKREKEEGKEEETSEQRPSSELPQGENSDVSKLAEFLINLNLWEQISEDVGVQVMNRIYEQADCRLSFEQQDQFLDFIHGELNVQALTKIFSQVQTQLGGLFDEIGNGLYYQIYSQVSVNANAQVSSILHSERDLVSDFLHRYYDESSRLYLVSVIHESFWIYQRQSVLSLLSPHGQNLRSKIARMLNQRLTPEQISQVLRVIQNPPTEDSFISNEQRAILESFLPHRSQEAMISNFVAGILITALASASANYL